MKKDVVISISGTQTPPGEAPETVELTTDTRAAVRMHSSTTIRVNLYRSR